MKATQIKRTYPNGLPMTKYRLEPPFQGHSEVAIQTYDNRLIGKGTMVKALPFDMSAPCLTSSNTMYDEWALLTGMGYEIDHQDGQIIHRDEDQEGVSVASVSNYYGVPYVYKHKPTGKYYIAIQTEDDIPDAKEISKEFYEAFCKQFG